MRKVAILALLLAAALPGAVLAHSVTMNWRFHIVDINDVIHNSTTYASAERGGTLAALVFAGSRLVELVVDAGSDPYLFQLTQDEARNRALLVLTSGTWPIVEQAPQGQVPATTFGNLTIPASIVPGLSLQLQYDAVQLSGALWPGQLLVRSLGRLRLPQLDLQVVG